MSYREEIVDLAKYFRTVHSIFLKYVRDLKRYSIDFKNNMGRLMLKSFHDLAQVRLSNTALEENDAFLIVFNYLGSIDDTTVTESYQIRYVESKSEFLFYFRHLLDITYITLNMIVFFALNYKLIEKAVHQEDLEKVIRLKEILFGDVE